MVWTVPRPFLPQHGSYSLTTTAACCAVEYSICDVADDKSIDDCVKSDLSKHKRVDWLVNNAGISGTFGVPVLDTRIEDINTVMNTNTFGPLKILIKLVPGMKDRGYGRIVNMS